MERKRSVWTLQEINNRNVTREKNLDLVKKGKPNERNWIPSDTIRN